MRDVAPWCGPVAFIVVVVVAGALASQIWQHYLCWCCCQQSTHPCNLGPLATVQTRLVCPGWQAPPLCPMSPSNTPLPRAQCDVFAVGRWSGPSYHWQQPQYSHSTVL